MRVKLVLAGEDGGARPPPLITFSLTSKVAVYAPAEWADTLTLFHLYENMYSVPLKYAVKSTLRQKPFVFLSICHCSVANSWQNFSGQARGKRWKKEKGKEKSTALWYVIFYFLCNFPSNNNFHQKMPFNKKGPNFMATLARLYRKE
jgi:hypothetical protein